MKVKENEYYKLCHVTGVTKFEGCQCYKDCLCHERFEPKTFEYWTVLSKKSKKYKKYQCANLEIAKERIDYILKRYEQR